MVATILYSDHAPVYGGAEVVLVRLLAALDRRWFAPLVAIGPCPSMEDALLARALRYRVLPMSPLNRRDWRVGSAALQSVLALRGLARSEHVTLLHTNTLRTHILGAIAAPLIHRPLIWTLHDMTCPLRIFRMFEDRASMIICASHAIRTAYAPACRHPEKMRVVYNGVDIPEVSPTQIAAIRQVVGAAPEQPIITVAGRLVRGKGQDVFISAAARLAERHPNALFVIAGNATDEVDNTARLIPMSDLNSGGASYESELHSLVAASGLSERVRFAGFLSDPSALYAASSVVVHPGTMEEGLPTVPIEAMAAGRPVVGTNIDAMREIIRRGETGLIVPHSDADGLALAIGALLDDPSRAAAMGAAGRERIRRYFSLERQVAEVTNIYAEVYDDPVPSHRAVARMWRYGE